MTTSRKEELPAMQELIFIVRRCKGGHIVRAIHPDVIEAWRVGITPLQRTRAPASYLAYKVLDFVLASSLLDGNEEVRLYLPAYPEILKPLSGANRKEEYLKLARCIVPFLIKARVEVGEKSIAGRPITKHVVRKVIEQERRPMTTGEIHKLVSKRFRKMGRMAPTRRAVYRAIRQLEQEGIVERTLVRRGAYGNTSLVRLREVLAE